MLLLLLALARLLHSRFIKRKIHPRPAPKTSQRGENKKGT
jgi:hypothetical protein